MGREVKLYALKVQQPLGEFYVGAIEANKIIEISTTDVRRFLDDNAESRDGIQRQ